MSVITSKGMWVPLLALAVASGCEREMSASRTAGPGLTAGGTEPAESTESSLTIRRGTLSLGAETRSFLPCGQTEALWLLDQSDAILEETYARLTNELGSPLYVEIRAERTVTGMPAGYSAALLVEELLYAGFPGEGGGCQANPPTYRVLARGNEPFWAVEVHVDRMLLRQPELAAPLEFSVEQSLDGEGSVTFRGTASAATLEVAVTSTACSDSMSGEYFAYTATARLDGQELHGCARLGE